MPFDPIAAIVPLSSREAKSEFGSGVRRARRCRGNDNGYMPDLQQDEAIRITAGRYAGFVGRVLSEPEGGSIRVTVLLFGAEHELDVEVSEVQRTDAPLPARLVVRRQPDGTIR